MMALSLLRRESTTLLSMAVQKGQRIEKPQLIESDLLQKLLNNLLRHFPQEFGVDRKLAAKFSHLLTDATQSRFILAVVDGFHNPTADLLHFFYAHAACRDGRCPDADTGCD